MVELGTKYFPGKVTNSLNNIISAIIPTILITNVNVFNLGRFLTVEEPSHIDF